MATIGQDEERGSRGLSVIAASLDAIPKDSEPSFMKIGRELQSIYSDATEFTRQTLETVKLFGGESEEGLLAKVGMIARATLEKVKGCQTEASEDLDLVDAHIMVVRKQLSETYALYLALKKTAKFLRTIGLQMHIECARSINAEKMFLFVAQEIRDLSNRFMEIAENIRDDSDTANESQISARQKTREALHQLFKLVDDAEQTVQSAVKEIERVMDLSIENLEQTGLRSKRISQHVGQIVMGIQFHDNMRQRLEHISEALVDVEKSCSEEASEDSNLTTSKASNSAYSTLELQKAQLQNIITEIKTVYEETKLAFENIDNEVDDLSRGLSVIENELSQFSKKGKIEKQDPFEYLQVALQHLHQLIEGGGDLIEGMQKTAAQASESITRLSSHTENVREISFETHLTAINAMIKAKQLGEEGRSLSSLVLEAANISGQTDMFVANAENIRGMITASANELQTQTRQGMRMTQDGDESRRSLDTLSEDISRQGIQFRENSLDTFKRADALRDAISKANAGLGFLPDLANDLKEYHRQLEETGRSLNLEHTPEMAHSQGEVDAIYQRYTMEEEREVHEQLIGLSNSHNDSNEDIEADGFSGVEMFTESFPPPSSEEADDAVDDNGDEEDDLGDNIELF